MMIRISVLSMMFALAIGTAGAQQLPAQPPPIASPMGQGNDQEHAACHPDVSRFCQVQLKTNPNDLLTGLSASEPAQNKPCLPAGLGEPRSISEALDQVRATIMRHRSGSRRGVR